MHAPAHSTTPFFADWRDRYRVVRRIGSGGSAEVFEARDLQLDEPVALKVVTEGRGMSGRVVREVEAAAALSHPNIVALYDWFGDGDHSYLVWELVDGASLDQLAGRLGDVDVAAVGVELLQALAFAHSQGVVHRDVKPQNVMLDRDGHVKVMDFGIARLLDADTLTGDGDVIGTIAYMSPEQASGRRVGPQSDVYSAGMVLYELLAGRNPLRGDTPAETLGNVAAGRLPALAAERPDVPAELADLVDATCQLAPAARPTAAELAEALDELVRSGRLGAGRLRQAQRLVEPLQRLGAAAERAGGAGLAAVTAGVVLGKLPAYPAGWTLPLVAVSAAVWAILPRAGLAWLLGVLAFPVFNVSLSLGVAYLVFAVALFLLARGRPVAALWPALALLLWPLHLTLLAPVGAAALGRVRGPLTAAWAAAVTFVYLLLVRAPRGPFTMYRPRGHLARELGEAGDPFTVVVRLAQVVLSPQCLLQMAVWAGLALAVGLIMAKPSLEARLWGWALAFAGVFAAYRIAPVGAWGYRASLEPLLVDVALAAGVVLLLVVLTPAGVLPDERSEEHGLLQID
jgi:serine/threonine-protein kinase